jgi:hypothetical protein
MSWCESSLPSRLVPIVSLLVPALLLAGCATAQPETRHFFVPEEQLESHGRKTWFDHLVELDPGTLDFQVADNYAQQPPRRIAVLPFIDHGSANYVVDKIPLSFRSEEQREQWAWTYANRLRRSLTGYLAQREFEIVNLVAVDTVLKDHGIDDWSKLKAIPPEQLGQWLGADTVVYGEVIHYEAYYAFLVASYDVGVRIRMVSTLDGHPVFAATDDRYSVDLRPSFDPMDIAINSGLALLQLRDITLARAEDEVGREVVLRIPEAKRNIVRLVNAAREQENATVPSDMQAGPELTSLHRPCGLTQCADPP